VTSATWKGRSGVIALTVWFGAMATLCAGLLARHLVALPAPGSYDALSRAMSDLPGPSQRGKWLAVHVLDGRCRCSQRIAEHLLQTARPHAWSEIVLWSGDVDPPAKLTERFDLRRTDLAELGRYGIESVPILVAIDPSGQVRYAGGYTVRKQGPVIDDLRLLAEAMREPAVTAMPVFGCAVSDRLRNALANLPTL